MKITYTWKNLDRSEAAETYCDDKMERVVKYLHNIISCEISLETVHNEISAHIKLHGDGNWFDAQNQDKDIYVCIDGLEDKIVKQVRRFHDKKSNH